MLYRIRWEIDLDADSPEEAAAEAYRIQKDGLSEATIFDVADYDEAKIQEEFDEIEGAVKWTRFDAAGFDS